MKGKWCWVLRSKSTKNYRGYFELLWSRSCLNSSMNPRLRIVIPLTLVSLFLLCGCQSHAPQKSAGLGSLEIVLELQEVEADSVRLWLDGSFIGGVSRAHPVFRIAAGQHTIRAVGTTTHSD